MSKTSLSPTNDFCPQTLFLYGTYDDEGKPNFGLFCWFSYTWDGELGVMACIGGSKLTKENIHKRKVFSANLVTEDLLPLADFLGNTAGHSPEKQKLDIKTEEGRVLPVPVLTASPVNYELEVMQFIPLHDGEVMLCRIRNIMQDDLLAKGTGSAAEKLAAIAPVHTTCQTYFSWSGTALGAWGEPMAKLVKE
ncbi:MAG: flavin reductase family protein [Clostridiales bacterium]|nr:flavin reductase family protein [Clostridiales bacterium]